MTTISIPLAEERSGRTKLSQAWAMTASAIVLAVGSAALSFSPAEAQEKRPNIVMLMTDDIGWSDFGAYCRRRQGARSPNSQH